MLQWAVWICLLSSVCVQGILAQTPIRGVVWDADRAPNTNDLKLIGWLGVQAVRLPIVEDQQLLAVADSLGLSLFQDLPVRYLSAPALMDSLESATAQLAAALERGRGHVSAGHYGLALYSDNSTDAACPYFAELARIAKASSDAKVYYVSPFIERDQCAEVVDFVLLDLRHAQDPSSALAEWPHVVPAGVGAFGTQVLDEAFGLKDARSPQSQARYFETHLTALLNSSAHSIFVYRWQDTAALDVTAQWGLLDVHGHQRPVYSVVRGLYTGAQNVFAFRAGTPAKASTPWLVLLGWLAILGLALPYAASTPWRNLVHRFLTRHGFYLDSVKLGREFPGVGCVVFVLVQALITGCVLWLVVHAIYESPAADPILASLPPTLMGGAEKIAETPLVAVTLFGALHLVYHLLLMLINMAVFGFRELVDFKRAFTLQVSAHWTCIFLLPMIMISPALTAANYQLLVGITAAAWILVIVFSAAQLVADYAAILPRRRRLAAVLQLMPQLLFLVGLLLWTFNSSLGASVGFWWHLIIRA